MLCSKALKYLKRSVKYGLLTVVIGPSFFTFVESQIATISWVDGVSMQPTLNPEISRSQTVTNILFLQRVHNRLSTIKRGDIVTFISPTDYENIWVKRVIGLEGDLIRHRTRSQITKIRQGHCWLEGDNGSDSMDSNTFGQVPMGLIQCKAVLIIWPLSMLGRLDGKTDMSKQHSSLIKRHKIAAGITQDSLENASKMKNLTSTTELPQEHACEGDTSETTKEKVLITSESEQTWNDKECITV